MIRLDLMTKVMIGKKLIKITIILCLNSFSNRSIKEN